VIKRGCGGGESKNTAPVVNRGGAKDIARQVHEKGGTRGESKRGKTKKDGGNSPAK